MSFLVLLKKKIIFSTVFVVFFYSPLSISGSHSMQFLSRLENLCENQNQLLLKKIMFGFVREGRSSTLECNSSLMLLWSECSDRYSCQHALKEYYEFVKTDSSILIGE